mgnify:CR=1 FL=1
MRMIRAFAAIPLPKAYQDGLAALPKKDMPAPPARLGWTRPGSWHLTLKFLGDVPESGKGGLEEVVGALAAIRFAPFALRGAGAGFFPDAGAPRTLWIGVDAGRKECADLAGLVEKALVPLGYAKERRPFSPHLTLARVRDGRSGHAKRAPVDRGQAAAVWRTLADDLAALDWPAFTVTGFTLFRSVLDRSGPVYSPLAEFPASDAPGAL